MASDQISMLSFVEFLSSSEDSEKEEEEDEKRSIYDPRKLEADVNETERDDKRATDSISNVKRCITKEEKNDNLKKNELMKTIKQLQTFIISLEKEKKSLLYKKSNNDSQHYKELEALEVKQNKEINTEKKKMFGDLNKISTKIEKFKRDKESLRKCSSYVEKLRISMEEIEKNIFEFKESQRLTYEEILLEEESLTQEIETYSKRIHQWSKKVEIKQYKNKLNVNDKGLEVPKEVEDFEEYLKATGGHQGGWDDIDHQAFSRLRRQNRNDEKLLALAMNEIPTQSRDEIITHIKWYKEYCFLKENKRSAIQKWKELKESERKGALSNAAQNLSMDDNRRKNKEKIFEKERLERLEKLKEWKLQKEEEETKKKNLNYEEREQIKLKQILEEKRQFELKQKVEKYKEQKKEEKLVLEHVMEEKASKERTKLTEDELDRIKERNEKLITMKKEKQLSKKYEEAEHQRRLEALKQQVAVNVTRDPSRLYKLTEGWKNRKKDKEVFNPQVGTTARLMPHRAIPSWRQGVS